nr:GNAT family N-acetyltransferase [Sulfitobacter sp. THAF37]
MRPARPMDAGAVGMILSEFVDTTPWMPRIHSRAQDLAHAGDLIELGWVTLAEDDRDVIGFAARNKAELHALYVARHARGQGVGSDLLRQAQAAAPSLTLWTFQANTGAQRFYLRHGFSETLRTDGARNDEGLPDIRYDWRQEAA